MTTGTIRKAFSVDALKNCCRKSSTRMTNTEGCCDQTSKNEAKLKKNKLRSGVKMKNPDFVVNARKRGNALSCTSKKGCYVRDPTRTEAILLQLHALTILEPCVVESILTNKIRTKVVLKNFPYDNELSACRKRILGKLQCLRKQVRKIMIYGLKSKKYNLIFKRLNYFVLA